MDEDKQGDGKTMDIRSAIHGVETALIAVESDRAELDALKARIDEVRVRMESSKAGLEAALGLCEEVGVPRAKARKAAEDIIRVLAEAGALAVDGAESSSSSPQAPAPTQRRTRRRAGTEQMPVGEAEEASLNAAVSAAVEPTTSSAHQALSQQDVAVPTKTPSVPDAAALGASRGTSNAAPADVVAEEVVSPEIAAADDELADASISRAPPVSASPNSISRDDFVGMPELDPLSDAAEEIEMFDGGGSADEDDGWADPPLDRNDERFGSLDEEADSSPPPSPPSVAERPRLGFSAPGFLKSRTA